MSTPGTPDSASEPIEPTGDDAAAPETPVTPTPPVAPEAGPAPAGTTPPGYDQSPYGQPGPTDPGYQQGGYPPGYQQPYQQPGYQQPYPPGYVAAAPLSPSDERMWATLAHVGPILVGFLAPLLIWLLLRERSRFVDDQGKEALNFQIFLAIVYVVGVITAALVIGIFILLAAWLLAIVFGIQGAIAANRGELYRYPFNWRVIK